MWICKGFFDEAVAVFSLYILPFSSVFLLPFFNFKKYRRPSHRRSHRTTLGATVPFDGSALGADDGTTDGATVLFDGSTLGGIVGSIGLVGG